ncbi:ATP-dependent deoxyribonuclease subunit B [Aerococcus agrisoli]|uniref:ATP-dependent deoxyribonuclease subunit B n=1 Tax=Aerococcus agrisoli TaxID=2487350 RepID=A0A3N4GRZ6_9LACT|nr:PD-(D/E)XK nuclease family protein [Aerococcus agrisoli]RPA65025.1 ATP-dependent deoxyribonuclease subunit B [Aerococcus agrisoli]
MSLQFILKTPTKDNMTKIYQDIDQYLQADADHQVFIITDDNMKFEMEMKVLREMRKVQSTGDKASDGQHVGMMRLQVQSFKRLAWYLLQKQDAKRTTGISDIANIMLIGRVLASIKDDLVVYRGEYSQIGFIEALADLFKELQDGQISAAFLADTMDQFAENPNPLVKNQVKKMKEIAYIFNHYETAVAGETLGEEDVFDQLRQALQTQDLSKTKIIITGFDYFNAQELATIVTLLEHTPSVQIVLNLDHDYSQQNPEWYELFTVTGKTYHQLINFARSQQLEVDYPIYAEANDSYDPAFQVLDHYLQTDNRIERVDTAQTAENKALIQSIMEIWEVPSVYMEADQVASQIYQLIADEDKTLRYKDIQILLRDEDAYQYALEAALKANDIPYFANFQDAMDLHPLYHFMSALFKVYRNNWRYQDVFDLLRTDLLTPLDIDDLTDSVPVANTIVEDEAPGLIQVQTRFRDAIDLTENVVLRNGYEGQFWWSTDRTWSYILVDEDGEKMGTERDIAIEATANRVKSFLAGVLQPLFVNWKRAQTTTEAVTYFYQFLVKSGVPDSLMAWRDHYLALGHLQEGRQHEQAWQTFVNMLDDYVQLFGEEPFDVDYFFSILDIAFQNASYAIVPPTMDAVTIASFDEGKVKPKKITFIMGMSKYALPQTYEEKSLLTDEDRELMAAKLDDLQAFKLSATTKNNNEAYKAYLAFLSATEHLYISYPINNGDKSTEGLSPMIQRIAQAFDIKTKHLRQPDASMNTPVTLKLGNGHSQVRYLLNAIAQSKHQGQAIATAWQPVYQQVTEHQATTNLLKWLRTSLDYHNIVRPLTAELARELYGEVLSVSVSQLELYNRDPFSYYLKYGLKLKERPSFKLDALQTGNYFHDVLDHVFKAIDARDFDMANLSEAEVDSILADVMKAFEDSAIYPEYTVFSVNNRNHHLQNAMKDTLRLLIENIIKQKQAVHLKTIETERTFGFTTSEEETDTLTQFHLANGQEVRLRGKIDRLDAAETTDETGNHQYIQVVDYKSSKHDVKFDEIYLGAQLQLFTYLGVALEALRREGHSVQALGAFYQRIFQPMVKIKEQKDLTDANIEEKIMSELKLSGYVRADYNVLDEIHEGGLPASAKSTVYSATRKKDGDFDRYSKVLTQDEIEQMLGFVQQKIVETAEEIVSGHIALYPIEGDKFIPSMTEPYRSVSMFDATDYMNKYRPHPKLDKENFFKVIQANQNDQDTDEEETLNDEETTH